MKSQVFRILIGRLGRALSVSFWVMVISFAIMRIIPGDPASARLGAGVELEAIEELRKTLNLNGSIFSQFTNYVMGLLQGDLGTSLQTGRTVIDIVSSTLPLTLYLIIFSTFFALLLSIPISTSIAWYAKAPIVYAFRGVTAVILATPKIL